MDDLEATIRMSLRGYAYHGATFWPSATAFMVIALRPDDMTSANATLICPACVKVVATTALSVMDQRAQGAYPLHSPGGALHLVGPAPIYDLIGVSELPFCMGCAECGSHVGCSSGCSDCRHPECACRCQTIGHLPTAEALVCRICGADLIASDTVAAIERAIATARRQDRIISDGCARAIAVYWFSAVYQGFHTPVLDFVTHGEINAGLLDAWMRFGPTGATHKGLPNPGHIAVLGQYLAQRGPRGPVPGCADQWVR